MSRGRGRAPRIFIGLREVAGFGSALKRGFDQLGIESTFLNIGYHPHEYQTENNPAWADRLARLSQKLGKRFTGKWWKRIIWIGFVQNMFSILALPRAILRNDAFIFVSVGSFFFFLELPLLKLFRKKIIYVMMGSDTRPVYLNGYVVSETGRKAMLTAFFLARIQKTVVWIIDRFADEVLSIPPQAYFHTRKIVNNLMVGLPAEYISPPLEQCVDDSSRVRILHAPSKPGPKGTDEIRRVLRRLADKGHQFDYIEISGRTHSDVLMEIQRSSFVIDELYSDTPLAGFATEAAFFGKPAIVGSYYSAHIRNVLRSEDIPPSMFIHPDDLEAAVERLITDTEFREDLGRRAQAFVRDSWSARRVAERYLMLIDHSYPEHWLFDPSAITYLEGCGLRKDRGIAVLSEFLKIGGRRGLCLEDKPDLARRFVAMVENAEASQPMAAPASSDRVV